MASSTAFESAGGVPLGTTSTAGRRLVQAGDGGCAAPLLRVDGLNPDALRCREPSTQAGASVWRGRPHTGFSPSPVRGDADGPETKPPLLRSRPIQGTRYDLTSGRTGDLQKTPRTGELPRSSEHASLPGERPRFPSAGGCVGDLPAAAGASRGSTPNRESPALLTSRIERVGGGTPGTPARRRAPGKSLRGPSYGRMSVRLGPTVMLAASECLRSGRWNHEH